MGSPLPHICPHSAHANLIVAVILTRKWRRVCQELPEAKIAFQELSAAAGKQQCQEWMREADDADGSRDHNKEAMDIYDVPESMCKAILH